MELSDFAKADFQSALIKKYRIVHFAKILSDFHHHGHAHVEDNGGAQSHKGRVNEKEPDAVDGEVQLFS